MAEIWLRKRKNGWNLIKKQKKRLKFDEICSNAFKFDQIHSNSWCTWWTNLIRMHSNQIGIFTKQNLSFVIWFTIQLNIVSISKWMCTFFSGKHYEELFNFFRLIATIIQKCYGERVLPTFGILFSYTRHVSFFLAMAPMDMFVIIMKRSRAIHW